MRCTTGVTRLRYPAISGRYDSYDKSLEAEPDRQDAIDNRELVKSLLEQQQQEQQVTTRTAIAINRIKR